MGGSPGTAQDSPARAGGRAGGWGAAGPSALGLGWAARGPDRAGRATLSPPPLTGQIQRFNLPSEGPRERFRPPGKPRPGTGGQGAPRPYGASSALVLSDDERQSGAGSLRGEAPFGARGARRSRRPRAQGPRLRPRDKRATWRRPSAIASRAELPFSGWRSGASAREPSRPAAPSREKRPLFKPRWPGRNQLPPCGVGA